MEHIQQEPPYHGPDADLVYSQSLEVWQALLSQAKTSRISKASLDLSAILKRIPELPKNIPRNVKWIEGFSTWRNSDPACCLQIKKENPKRVFLTKLHPTICDLSTPLNFQVWEGGENNGLGLLILGWAYVLSAELAERQGLSIEYTPHCKKAVNSRTLDLGYASPAELRWWKAIATPGVGWSITGERVSPWAVSVQNLAIDIRGDIEDNLQPPTARDAAHYLSKLCDAYGLGSQCSAALAAALTIPLHASTSSLKPARIELPQPVFSTRIDSPYYSSTPNEYRLIGYYMTLSLASWALGPSLWSVFWNEDIPCNFAGAWLTPIAAILKPIIQNNNMELLAKILSFSPMFPLWVGIILCGRRAIIKSIIPYLSELRDYPFSSPSIDAAAWTGSAHSFFDGRQMPLDSNDTISRADVWRLRHDCSKKYSDDEFSTLPSYGWPPFGRMRADDVELEIRGHLACSHEWSYLYWTWLLDGSEVDSGFAADYLPTWQPREGSLSSNTIYRIGPEESKTVEMVSRTATKAVFWWCCGQVEKGFGGTIVPHRPGRDEPLINANKSAISNPEFIQNWLQTVTS